MIDGGEALYLDGKEIGVGSSRVTPIEWANPLRLPLSTWDS